MAIILGMNLFIPVQLSLKKMKKLFTNSFGMNRLTANAVVSQKTSFIDTYARMR